MLANKPTENLIGASALDEELELFVRGKGLVIKTALLRERSEEADYHLNGIQAFLYLLECVFQYPSLFKKETVESLRAELKDFLR